MKYFLLLLLLLLPMSSFAETDKSEYRIDWKYNAGKYFIYDCVREHYACVNLEGNTNCLEERNFAIEKKAKTYPCAPLAVFGDKKTCVEKQYQVLLSNAFKRFCYPK